MITPAEMRARLTALGLTVKDLATITGWDYRDLRRQSTAQASMTKRIGEKLTEFEAMAEADMAVMLAEAENGKPVVIPAYSSHGTAPYLTGEGTMPGPYWHALAGRLIVTDNITVIYSDE